MKIIVLGIEPSTTLDNTENQVRTRSSIIIKNNGKNILIDCAPNFLELLDKNNVDDLEAVVFTNGSDISTSGIKQLEQWMLKKNKSKIPCFGNPLFFRNIHNSLGDTEFLDWIDFQAEDVISLAGMTVSAIPTKSESDPGSPLYALKFDDGKSKFIFMEGASAFQDRFRQIFNNCVLMTDADANIIKDLGINKLITTNLCDVIKNTDCNISKAFSGMSIDIDLSEKEQENDWFAVEKKFDGLRCILNKKDNEVKIFSEHEHDITENFPSIVESSKSLSPDNLIIDGELVDYSNGKPSGKAHVIRLMLSDEKPNDNNVVLHVFDLLYANKNMIALPWYERQKVLKTLNFSKNIKRVEAVVVKNLADLNSAINAVNKLPGSGGAIIKRYISPYTLDKLIVSKGDNKISELSSGNAVRQS